MRIVIRKAGHVVSSHDLLTGSLSLGRSKNNQITLLDSSVSREHGRIFVENNKLFYEDLKSNNGSFLRGKKVDRVELSPGDKLTLGMFEVSIEKNPSFDPDKTVHSDDSQENTAGEAIIPDENNGDDEKTLPPSSLSDSTQTEFLAAMAGPLKQEKTEFDVSNLNVLQKFLKDDEPQGDPDSARLVRLDGPMAGNSLPIEKDEVTLGKAPNNDIVIEKPDVSVAHAVIEHTGEHFILKNHDHSTQTFVDGVPVQERELENHDVVEIGSARFEFVQGSSRSRAEGSKVVERSPSIRIGRHRLRLKSWVKQVKTYSSDWRVLGFLGVIIGVMVVWVVKPSPETRTVEPQPPPPSSVQKPNNSDEEKERVLRFSLDRARRLFQEGKYDEAESRLNNILDHLAPNNPEAIAMLQKVDEARSLVEKQTDTEEEEVVSPPKKKSVKKKLKLSKKDEANRLKKLYQKGVAKFEYGNLSEAATLLQEVAETKGNPNQRSAKNLLKEIQKKSSESLSDHLQEIQTLYDSGEVEKAFTEAQKLAQKNPDSKPAYDLFHKIQADLENKAKKAYMEGITFLEVVEDKPAALERFEEALRFAVDPQSRYREKAQQKINELKSRTP